MADSGWGSSNDAGGWGDSNNNDSSFNDDKGGDSGERKKGCFKCGEEGHNKADCPQAGDEPPKKCFKCGGDHFAKECEKPDVCRMCGEEGHMSKECSGAKTHSITKEDGTKQEIYIPKEVADDDLFQQGISSGINFDKFDKIPVKCSGDNAPPPATSFESMGLRQLLRDNVDKSGYKKPTPIQKYAIPIIMNKRDLMACAQTGSGKTAAFLLPILHNILEDECDPHTGDAPQKPQAVIVAPTRELALQIKEEARKFALQSVAKAVVAYGGTSTGYQLTQLFKGCNVLIATPGRLMDFVEKGKVSFEDVRYLVLDEADRMLDMGFLPEMQRIVSHSTMPPKEKRQTLMFSATFAETVQHLALDFLNDYLFLAVGIVGGASSDVEQTFLKLGKFEKREKLLEILKEVGTSRTLVFVETKKNADFLAAFLSEEGLPTTSIHGDRLQREREEALNDFKTGRMPILVATAVAARGLDIKDVAHVVNFDMPKDVDEYVHRIGRTGRVGNKGKATSFYDPEHDSDVGGAVIKILSECQQEVPDFLADAGMGGSTGGFGGVDIRSGQDSVSANAADEDDGW
eukprot:10207.XXX_366939_369038_1 [CDS] Oithona nana genome sequencing.